MKKSSNSPNPVQVYQLAELQILKAQCLVHHAKLIASISLDEALKVKRRLLSRAKELRNMQDPRLPAELNDRIGHSADIFQLIGNSNSVLDEEPKFRTTQN